MNRSHTFAHLIARDLRDGVVETKKGVGFHICGRLDVGPVIATVRIFVPWRFRGVKRRPPIVYCVEPWMRTGSDWHNAPPLCWTLPELWRDCMARRQKPVASIMSEGCLWMKNNVSALIAKHHYADIHGLNEWQPEWEFWGHGRKGVEEYKREKAKPEY